MLKNVVQAYNRQEKIWTVKGNKNFRPLPHISAHILRHTACTRLAESGLDPKVLQYIMGRASISVTMDIYTHLDFSQIRKKIEAVQEKTMIG